MKEYLISNRGSDTISISEFCPFEAAGDVLAFGTQHSLVILNTIPQFNVLKRIETGVAINCLSWSPLTTLDRIIIAVGFQKSLRIYDNDEIIDLIPSIPFKEQIQDVAIDNINGRYLASICDDKLLRIWCNSNEWATIPMISRGIELHFHKYLADHLLLAEESGSIRLLNVNKKEWIFSIHDPLIFGLASIDWNPEDPNIFAAVVENKWYIWNLGKSCLKYAYSGDAYSNGTHTFRWSKVHPKQFSIAGMLPQMQANDKSVRIYESTMKKVPIFMDSSVGIKGLSWNVKRNTMMGFGNHSLIFWEF